MLNGLGLGWDDKIPEQFFETWVNNISTIQDLGKLKFNRSIIPPNAKSDKIELIISADASKNIAIASVHSRVPLNDGSFFVQLVCAKSKITSESTIPRGELRAATMAAILGHVVRKNLGERVETSFVNINFWNSFRNATVFV